MSGAPPAISEIRKWETQLLNQTDPLQKIIYLEKLISNYIFTNIKKAQKYLGEQAALLKEHPNPDHQLNYHLNISIIENQLYNYRLAEYHIRKAIPLVEDRGDVKQQAETYIDYAGTCINMGKKEEAYNFLDKADRLLEVFPDELMRARVLTRRGYLHIHLNDFAKASELLLEADKLINIQTQRPLSLKDHYFQTMIHSGMGSVYKRNDEGDKSVRAYLKVVNMCETLGMKARLCWHYLNVGSGYMVLTDDVSAEEYFRKAIKMVADVSQNARASAYANLGFIYFSRRSFTEALSLIKKAERLYREKPGENLSNLSLIENWKGRLYKVLGKPNKAIEHFRTAFEYAEQQKDFKQMAIISKDTADYYVEKKEYEKAYKYQSYQIKFESENQKEVNKQMLMEYEVKYDAEKRTHEAKILRLQASQLQLRALRAQMNPHFMYNALNSIQAHMTSDDSNAAAKYLAKFAKLMRQSLDYSDYEVISLEKELEFLQDYLFINQKLRYGHLQYEFRVDPDIEDDIMGIPTMIIQPYVENAIEHGIRTKDDGLVKITFDLLDEHTIICTVTDNGIGRKAAGELKANDPKYSNHNSKGTSITEKRLELLHKSTGRAVFVETFDVVDTKTKAIIGTKVKIRIPIQTIQKYVE